MLYKQVWISILNLLTIPTTAKLNARAASLSASSSSSAQIILANEAATSYNASDLLPTQLSALYQLLQDTPTATPSLTKKFISYDAGNFTAAAAATSLAASLAAFTSTAIIIPPPINNPLTAAPPPEATSPPVLYFGSDVPPVHGYYVVATTNSAPYPIANATTGLGIAPGNVTGIVPFTGQGCGWWEMGFRWQWCMMMGFSAVVLLARVFL